MVRRLIQGIVPSPEATAEKVEEVSFAEKLKKLIPQFKKDKTAFDALKKVTEKQNAEIKEIMKANDLTEFEVDDVKVTYSVQDKSSFNEAQLIAKLKELKIPGVVKKKEYIDENALEDAIFKDGTLAEKISICMEQKLVPTLRLGKVKKNTDDE